MSLLPGLFCCFALVTAARARGCFCGSQLGLTWLEISSRAQPSLLLGCDGREDGKKHSGTSPSFLLHGLQLHAGGGVVSP